MQDISHFINTEQHVIVETKKKKNSNPQTVKYIADGGTHHMGCADPFLPKKWVKGIFFQKSASAKMKPLDSLNFRPKIRKILRAVFQKK